MKRYFAMLIVLIILLFGTTGCSQESAETISSAVEKDVIATPNNTNTPTPSPETVVPESNSQEVPDSFIETDLQRLLLNDENNGIKLTVSHNPDVQAHTDTVNIDVAILYELGWEHYRIQACYQYNKSNDLWSQLWMGEGQYIGCEFVEENIVGYYNDGKYSSGEQYEWEYEIRDINLNTMEATIAYYITLSIGQEEIEWNEIEVIPLEYESYNSYSSVENQVDHRYVDRITARIDCSYTTTQYGETWGAERNLELRITAKGIGAIIQKLY